MTQDNPKNHGFARPAWNQAAAWLGADFFALARMISRNGFRVHPGRMADCGLDLFFALLNTALAALQSFYYGPRLSRMALPDDPIFIIGHWRTGTTLLHELLALDPRNRCPTTLECFSPNHFLISEQIMWGWTGFLLPNSRPTDNMAMGWDRPQEDEFALCNMGVPSPYWAMAFPNEPQQSPEYFDLENVPQQDLRRWKRTLAKFLKQLLCKRPGRLVLKSPTHTFRLPTLLEMFPKARFVNMVRNPYDVYASTVRLWKSLYVWQGYQEPTLDGLEEHVFRTFEWMHNRLEATRGLVDPSRYLTMRYEDLVREPIAQVRAMYGQFGMEGFDEVEPALAAYFRERSDYRTNRHELAPQLRDRITRRWAPYIRQYGYEEPASGGEAREAARAAAS